MKAPTKLPGNASTLQGTLTEFQRGKKDLAEFLRFCRQEEPVEVTEALRSISNLLVYGAEHGNKPLDGFAAYGLSMLLDECAEDIERDKRRFDEIVDEAITGRPSERIRKLRAREDRAKRRGLHTSMVSPGGPKLLAEKQQQPLPAGADDKISPSRKPAMSETTWAPQ